jgi:hypothetical protein
MIPAALSISRGVVRVIGAAPAAGADLRLGSGSLALYLAAEIAAGRLALVSGPPGAPGAVYRYK